MTSLRGLADCLDGARFDGIGFPAQRADCSPQLDLHADRMSESTSDTLVMEWPARWASRIRRGQVPGPLALAGRTNGPLGRKTRAGPLISLLARYTLLHRFVRGLAVLCVGWLAFVSGIVSAAPPESLLSQIQRIDVPADRPGEWPREVKQSVAVPRDEFERLLKGAEIGERGPRRVRLTSARYSATLAGQSLREGRATWTVQRVGSEPALHPLGEFSLALQDLAWPERPAVWGSDVAGQAWLLADVPTGELTATWSAAGRSLPGEIDFDVTVPSAAVSVFDVKVPRDRLVRANPEARRIADGSDKDWQVWRIQLGSERHCRLAIAQPGDSRERPPTILYNYELAAVVREEDVRFQTLFQLEVFDAPVSEVTFTVPASVEVYAVTYGADLPLTWSRSDKAEAGGTLTVQLPGALQGRSRPIRIDGLAVHKPGQPTVSPQIDVKGGVFSSGRQRLTIVAPIQLRSVRANGFRQQGAVTLATEGEIFSFRQLLPNAQLILDVQRPRASLAAQVTGLLETGEDSWTLTSELVWTSSSGGVFQTGSQFPPDWEITDVQFVSKQGATKLAGWDVQPQPGGGTLLSVEFLEAIEPGRPHTVKVLARRRTVSVGQSFALPVPHPRDCDSVETTLGLVVPAGLNPLLSEEARLERVSPPDDSSIAALRRRPPTRTRNEFWFRGDTPEAAGSLQLVTRLRPVSATTEVIVEAAPAEYRERFRIRCRADGSPLDRLLVYLTQPGSEVRWSVLLPRPGDLTAVRLPLSQHAEWNCPAVGELWELRLPPLPAGPIEIEGTRSNRWSQTAHPALLFVPQSAERRGQVQLRRPETLELTIDPRGLDPHVAATDEAAAALSAADAAASFITSAWQFDAFDDELSIALSGPISSREYPTMVSLQLRSLISSNSDGFDLYRARIRLENGAAQETLRVRLPSPAVLQEATVAGEAIVPNAQGEELLIPGLNAARRDVVELLYRVPARGHTVRDARRVIVPVVAATVLGFDWEFALPPSVRLFSEPLGVRLARPLPSSTWTERLFGPLGRPRDESLFNPFAIDSWRELLQPREVPMSSVGELNGELIAPVEWQVHNASAAIVPEDLWLVTWHSTRARLLSWIALALAMSVGIVLRIVGWRYRDRLAAYWLTVLTCVALCSPSPYAEIAGGAIAGTIMALLAPRRSLLFHRGGLHASVPGGSTQSFRIGKPTGSVLVPCGLVVAGCWIVNGFAQETPPSTTPAARLGATGEGLRSPVAAGDSVPDARSVRDTLPFTIFVPVDDKGQPSKTLPLIYVMPELLSKMKAAAQTVSPPPDWLITAARYRAVVGTQGSVSLQAKFRVHVLDDSAERQIVIPIPEAVLAGADACRLNGKPHPVTTVPAGRGFVVTWSRPPSDVDRAEKAPRVSDPDASGRPGHSSDAASFDVELDLKRVGSKTSSGGGFSATIPAIADTNWSVELTEATEFLDVIGGRGASSRTADRRGIETQVGGTSHLDVRWSQVAPVAKPSQLEVSLLQTLDLRPSFAELRFRARCVPVEGQFDFLELDLPKGCLFRESDIRAAGLLRAEVLFAAAGSGKLRLTFAEPQRQPFTVDGTLIVPAADPDVAVPLPRFGLTRGPGLRVSMLQNWWWIGAAPEYRVDVPNLDAEVGASLSAAEFLQAWGDSPPTGRPQLVFQPREGETPQFSIVPQIARRRALRWTQVGHIGKRRLEWTLDAKLEATQAPVFQHVLFVDRRLQIEAISIRENGAERLVRWSEARPLASPTRVVLFLGDKTTGVQELTVRASLPLRHGPPVPLPFVRCEEAELVDSRWELFRDPELDVDLILPRGVPAFETPALKTGDDPSTEEGPQLVARYQIADPDPKTSIRVSSRHAPCTARTVAVLAKTDTRGWKLTGQLWLTPQGESPRRLGVRFPANLVDPARVRVEQAEATWHDPVDGWRRLDLALPPDPTEVALTFDFVIEEPLRGDWELPWPAPLQAASHEMCLVVAPADVWTPLVGTELKPDEAPGWADEFLEERMPDTTSAVYRLGAAPVRLRRLTSTTQLDEPVVRMLEHSLWLTADGGRHGLTRAFLSQTRDAIEFTVPDGFQPIALFFDDRPLPLPTVTEGLLRVPLVGGGRESVLVLIWEQLRPQSEGYARAERETLPWPSRVTVSRSLVTVLPHRNGLVIGRTRQALIDWMEAAFDRLEMLLDRQASLDNDPRAAAANRELIDELQSRVAARLPAHTTQASSALTARLERWNRIVESINGLERVVPLDRLPLAARPLSYLEEQFVDHPQALRTIATSAAPRVSFWLVDRRWLAVVLALLLSLIVIPSLRQLIRLDWGEWLSVRATISWLLLGVIWWFYLTPGFLGPLMIAVATLRAMLHRSPPVELNSTIGGD